MNGAHKGKGKPIRTVLMFRMGPYMNSGLTERGGATGGVWTPQVGGVSGGPPPENF